MEKTELTRFLDDLFIPLGFKRKGNYWVSNGEVITKMIHLQKSNFGNQFYINYGYILAAVPLQNVTMHVYNRLASSDKSEQKTLTDLLNLETDIPKVRRLAELRRFVDDKIVSRMRSVNSDEDVLHELKKRPHLNDIPLVVKKYFNLEEA